MRIKDWLKYGTYIILLSLLIFLKEYVIGKLQLIYNRSWGSEVNYYLLISMPLIFNIIIGMFFGLNHFIGELKKVGSWKINVPKIVIIGLPSLFFSLTYHLACINYPFVQSKLLGYTTLGTNFIPVFQIVLGYVFITCLYKHYREDIR